MHQELVRKTLRGSDFPNINWQEQYKGWRAIRKLNYVDEVASEIKGKEPLVKKGKPYWEAKRMGATLKNFYKQKRHSYAEEFPDFHDSNLKRIFIVLDAGEKTPPRKDKNTPYAAETIKRHRRDILNNVARWTGEKKHIIANLLDTLIQRCRELKLIVVDSESLAVLKISTYVTTLVMNYIYTGRFSKNK